MIQYMILKPQKFDSTRFGKPYRDTVHDSDTYTEIQYMVQEPRDTVHGSGTHTEILYMIQEHIQRYSTWFGYLYSDTVHDSGTDSVHGGVVNEPWYVQ